MAVPGLWFSADKPSGQLHCLATAAGTANLNGAALGS